jgi:hypothetical protein
MTLYFAVGPALQLWSVVRGPVPLMNYGSPLWIGVPVYVLVAPVVAWLLWSRKTRARSSVYMFGTFDLLRSARAAHWLPAVLDVLIVIYLQTPAMRRIYPSVWSRTRVAWRRRVWRWQPRG